MSPSDDPLQPVMERLRDATPAQPESIAPVVWRRIAQAERVTTPWRWWERVESVFAQPAFAAAFVVGCCLAGLFLAEVRASWERAQQNEQIERHYLRLVDPLLRAQPSATPVIFSR